VGRIIDQMKHCHPTCKTEFSSVLRAYFGRSKKVEEIEFIGAT